MGYYMLAENALENEKIIAEKGIELLSRSIQIQKEREKKAYKALGIKEEKDEISFKKFKKALYGEDEETGKGNKQEKALQIVSNFLIDFFNQNGLESNVPQNSEISLASQILDNFYNITEKFKEWYNNNNIKTLKMVSDEEELSLEKIIELEKIWNTEVNTTVLGKLKMKDSFTIYEEMKNNENFEMKSPMALEIIDQYKNKKNDFFGLLGEAATEYCVDSGVDLIITQTARRENNSQQTKDKIEKYETGYRERLSSKLNEISKKEEIFGKDFSLKVSSELKADVIFETKIEIGDGDSNGKKSFFTFGVSNKTGYSEKSKRLKIQTTSLKAIIQNLFKIDSELIQYTEEIAMALRDLALEGAIVFKWNDNEVPFSGFEEIVNNLVNKYAYVWFTEGDSSYSHADFFSVYKKDELHFIPMSYVLNKIQENKAKFEKIKMYKYIYDGNILSLDPVYEEIEKLEGEIKELSDKEKQKIITPREKRDLKDKKTLLNKKKDEIGYINNANKNTRLLNAMKKEDRTNGEIFSKVLSGISIPSDLAIGNFKNLI